MPINMQIEYPKLQNEVMELKIKLDKANTVNKELLDALKRIKSDLDRGSSLAELGDTIITFSGTAISKAEELLKQ